MKKILLTGGSGFIGKNILESYLAQKYEILAPSHKDIAWTDEEAVADLFQNNKIDFVIHAATKPGHRNAPDHSDLLYHNSRMFFNLAKNSDFYQKMLVLGSGAIYDMRNYQPKMKEEYFGTHIPVDPHGYNKYICGKYIETQNKIVDLRILGIFGKYEDYAIRFISNLICKAIFNLPLSMHQNRKFDYLDAADLMPILDFFMENKTQHQAYNITPDQTVELYDLAEMIRKISGKNLEIVVAKEGYNLEYSADNSRLKNEMKNLNFTPIKQAIEKLYGWYLENKNNIKIENLLINK